MKFKLVSGVGISATNAEKRVKEGYTRNQVVVQIFSGGSSEEYFLRCANGLVSKRWPDLVSEKAIGGTRTVDHSTSVNLPLPTVFSDTVVIVRGGSLCRDLGMSNEEALKFAEKYNLQHHSYIYDDEGTFGLFVKIHVGDQFHRVGGRWEPIK
jgi:hypothetical protein